MRPVVLKFGGELLEDRQRVASLASTIANLTRKKPLVPLVIVHGGGREIDAALARVRPSGPPASRQWVSPGRTRESAE
jgi:acetylglutamate kinase